MCDLHGYDRATCARVAQERAYRQLQLLREQRSVRPAVERQQRTIIALLVAQQRHERETRG